MTIQRRMDGRIEWIDDEGVGHTIAVPKRYRDSKAWWSHGCNGNCSKPENKKIIVEEYLDYLVNGLQSSDKKKKKMAKTTGKGKAKPKKATATNKKK